jgi:hypothetical protein
MITNKYENKTIEIIYMSFRENSQKPKYYGFSTEKFSSQKSRFHAIYFLDNLTGALLLSKKYTDSSEFSSNEDLISGFLNALNLFIKEIKSKSKNDEIQEINFQETRLLYARKERLLVIAITRKTNLQIERGILTEIVNDFYSRFEHAITHFNGIIDPCIKLYKQRLEKIDLNSLFRFQISF